jgi:hypothetical protein
MNGDKTLREAAKQTLLTRFWFVGILEKLDQVMQVDEEVIR